MAVSADVATPFKSLPQNQNHGKRDGNAQMSSNKCQVGGGGLGFYSGRIGKAIVEAVQQEGGLLTEDDLIQHATAFPAPISTTYRGLTVYELPPPNQASPSTLAVQSATAFLTRNSY